MMANKMLQMNCDITMQNKIAPLFYANNYQIKVLGWFRVITVIFCSSSRDKIFWLLCGSRLPT